MRTAMRGWFASALILAAGCAGTGPRMPQSAPTQLESVAQWQAKGRIAVAGSEGGGSGSFDWQQQHTQTDVTIRGPIGIGSLRVRLDGEHPERARLQLGDGRQLESQAAWAELEARLGAPVPAQYLRYWLLGLAAPGPHEWLERSDAGATLLQEGWRIEFLKYMDVNGLRTPSQIKATSGAARIRLVIDRWRLGP
jgi:outer membrane lipoprotein LolB